MDTSWCLVCGKHTADELYCSTACAEAEGGTVPGDDVSGRTWVDEALAALAAASTASSSLSSSADTSTFTSPAGSPRALTAPSSLPWAGWAARLRCDSAGDDGGLSVSLGGKIRSPPAQLLAEIRLRPQAEQHRRQVEMPRRRGLPFFMELQVERLRAELGGALPAVPTIRVPLVRTSAALGVSQATLCNMR